jgi:hypothetical protein
MALLGTFLADSSVITSHLSTYPIGEMHFTPSERDSTFNLPRAGGVAFAVQESWVQNETIRENILFHSPYNEERYKKGSFAKTLSSSANTDG